MVLNVELFIVALELFLSNCLWMNWDLQVELLFQVDYGKYQTPVLSRLITPNIKHLFSQVNKKKGKMKKSTRRQMTNT